MNKLMHNSLFQGGVVLIEVGKEEKDLVKGEAKLSAIILDHQDFILEVVPILRQHVHTVKGWIILLRSFHNLFISGKPKSWGNRTNLQM